MKQDKRQLSTFWTNDLKRNNFRYLNKNCKNFQHFQHLVRSQQECSSRPGSDELQNILIEKKNIPIAVLGQHYTFPCSEVNLDRKTLLSRPATAILALKWNITHHTPSVFHADQRGNRRFLIRTLGPELRHHPHPHGGPKHQQGQGLILEHISSNRYCQAQRF